MNLAFVSTIFATFITLILSSTTRLADEARFKYGAYRPRCQHRETEKNRNRIDTCCFRYHDRIEKHGSKHILYMTRRQSAAEKTSTPQIKADISKSTHYDSCREFFLQKTLRTRRETPKVIDELTPGDYDFYAAEAFGIQKMNELSIGERRLHSLGLFLEADDPAHHIATFNKQSKEAKRLANFAYAALKGSTMLHQKYPDIPIEIPFSRRTPHVTALNELCPRKGKPQCLPASLKYRTADGTCNNLRKLWWGSTMSTMKRFLPPVYDDKVQEIRKSVHGHSLPSPRRISSIIHQNKDMPLITISLMLMQWGQFVDHDIVATAQSTGFNGTFPRCCLGNGIGFQSPELMHPDCLPISVDRDDKFFGPLGVRCLEFVRSSPAPRENCMFGPREQLSQVTSFLDASMVYSSNAQITDSLRLFQKGMLRFGANRPGKPNFPFEVTDFACQQSIISTRCFKPGDGRLDEQPALVSMHIVFLRLHNKIAMRLAELNHHWSDEKLFQESRRIIGALVQLITFREFLPVVLGPNVIEIFDLELEQDGYYEGYDDTIEPNVVNSFSSAAYRFGHSLVQQSFVRVDNHHRPVFTNVTIHNEFTNRANLHTPGSLDRLLLGLVDQPCQKRDEFITDELTNHLFQTRNSKFGMDLASINIQRGRDHGLPPYVDWRITCGLSAVRNWNDFERVTSSSAARKFRQVYAALEDVDLFSAGLAEKPVLGGLIGPTFACIIAQQFSNLRKGDRFWFENGNQKSSFAVAQLRQIKKITLAQILCETTDIRTIQPFVFLTPDTLKNQRVFCDDKTIGRLNLQAWAESDAKPVNISMTGETHETGKSEDSDEVLKKMDSI